MSSNLLIFVAVFAVFIPALMLPGPDFIGVVRSSLSNGTKAGLLTTAGVTVGLGFFAILSLVGLSAIMAQYQWLATAVRVAGGLYLCYLGIRLLLTKQQDISPGLDAEAKDMRPHDATRSFLFGFGVTLTNPKAIVLFASVFAPAISAETPNWLLVAMVGLVMLASAIWYTCVTLFMTALPVMERFKDARHWIERVAGVCFIAIGGKIMADARSPIAP
ncbi:MAG: LysE family translocator [Rhizobiaceae bacterium]